MPGRAPGRGGLRGAPLHLAQLDDRLNERGELEDQRR